MSLSRSSSTESFGSTGAYDLGANIRDLPSTLRGRLYIPIKNRDFPGFFKRIACYFCKETWWSAKDLKGKNISMATLAGRVALLPLITPFALANLVLKVIRTVIELLYILLIKEPRNCHRPSSENELNYDLKDDSEIP